MALFPSKLADYLCGIFFAATLSGFGAEVRLQLVGSSQLPVPQFSFCLSGRKADKTIELCGQTDARGSAVVESPAGVVYFLYAKDRRELPMMKNGAPQMIKVGDESSVTATIQVELEGAAQGRVVDSVSRAAIAGVRITAFQVVAHKAGLGAMPVQSAVSDRLGAFSLALAEGQYVFEVRDPKASPVQWGADANKAVDGYFRAKSETITVYPGAVAAIGTIALEKKPLRRIEVKRVSATSCNPGEQVLILVTEKVGTTGVGQLLRKETPCFEDGVLTLAIDSPLEVSMWQLNVPATRRAFGLASILPGDRAILVEARDPLAVNGKVLYKAKDDSTAVAFDGTSVEFSPLQRVRFSHEQPAKVSAEGAFVQYFYDHRPVLVKPRNVPAGFCVSEVQYNGGAASQGVLQPQMGAVGHDVVLELKRLTGGLTVKTPGALKKEKLRIIAVRWPPEPFPDGFEVRSMDSKTGESVTFDGLCPGAMRVFALPEAEAQGIEGDLQALRERASSAKEIAWDFGETKQIVVDVGR